MCQKSDLTISVVFVPIRPTSKGLIGFANLTYNNQIALNGVAVYTKPSGEGIRLVYPLKILSNGKEVNYFCPLNREIGDVLTDSVSKVVFNLINKSKGAEYEKL